MQDFVLSAELIAYFLDSFESDFLAVFSILGLEDVAWSEERGTEGAGANDSQNVVVGYCGHGLKSKLSNNHSTGSIYSQFNI